MSSAPSKKRVLVLDDHPAFGRAMVKMLSGLGYIGKHVETVSEAVAAVSGYDAALVDIILGDGDDGVKAGRLLRAIVPKIKIIYTSGDPVAVDAFSWRKKDETFLAKGFSADDLGNALAALLRGNGV